VRIQSDQPITTRPSAWGLLTLIVAGGLLSMLWVAEIRSQPPEPPAPRPPEPPPGIDAPSAPGGPPPPGGGFDAGRFGDHKPRRRRDWRPEGFGGSMSELLKIDRDLQNGQVHFTQMETRRVELLDRLDEAKRSYQPDKADTQTLLARQLIDQLLKELHGLSEQTLELVNKGSHGLMMLSRSREQWGPTLNKEWENYQADRKGSEVRLQEADAMFDRWRAALRNLEKGNGLGFAQTLLGDDLGLLVFQSMPDWPPEDASNAGEGRKHAERFRPRHREFIGEQIRKRLRGRLDRIEQGQLELRQKLDAQDREIERLHRILQSGPDEHPPQPRP